MKQKTNIINSMKFKVVLLISAGMIATSAICMMLSIPSMQKKH